MKKSIVFLALLLLASLLCSCGNNAGGETETSGTKPTVTTAAMTATTTTTTIADVSDVSEETSEEEAVDTVVTTSARATEATYEYRTTAKAAPTTAPTASGDTAAPTTSATQSRKTTTTTAKTETSTTYATDPYELPVVPLADKPGSKPEETNDPDCVIEDQADSDVQLICYRFASTAGDE